MILVVDLLGGAAALVVLALLALHLLLVRRAGPLAGRLLAEPPVPCVPNDPPDVLVQIPVFNEIASVEGALEAAAALDWPRGKLHIQLLDDSTDGTGAIAAAAVARLAAAGAPVEHLVRSERRGFKAGALSAGLARCGAPFVAVLDADFRPPADWLARAVPLLLADGRAAFCQFRFEFANRDRNLMTRAQQLTVDAHFLSEQAGRLALGAPFQFNGTAGIWRRAAIEDAGGWSADTLAEDLDLTLRVFASGWHGILALAPALPCEAPADLAAWRHQQQRWSKGFVQVALKNLPRIRHAPWSPLAKLAATQLLAMQLAFPCALLAGAAFLADGMLRGFGAGHALVAAIAAAVALLAAVGITWPAHRRLRRGGSIRYAVTLAALPPLFAFLAAANSAAILAAGSGGEQEFVRTPKSGTGTAGQQGMQGNGAGEPRGQSGSSS